MDIISWYLGPHSFQHSNKRVGLWQYQAWAKYQDHHLKLCGKGIPLPCHSKIKQVYNMGGGPPANYTELCDVLIVLSSITLSCCNCIARDLHLPLLTLWTKCELVQQPHPQIVHEISRLIFLQVDKSRAGRVGYDQRTVAVAVCTRYW